MTKAAIEFFGLATMTLARESVARPEAVVALETPGGFELVYTTEHGVEYVFDAIEGCWFIPDL